MKNKKRFKASGKKKSKEPRSLSHLLLSLITVLILSGFYWITETTTTPHLPETGKPIELYANQNRQDLRQTLSQAIDNAQQSVLLIIYGLTDAPIINSLKQKADQGVQVQVIYDPEASRGVAQKLGPNVKSLKYFSKGLMHLKVLVVDEKQVWVGSANMTSESLRVHGNLVSGVESPQLSAFIKEKASCMLREEETNFPHRNYNINGQDVEMWFFPDDPNGVNRLKELIHSSKKTIRVAMFTWTRFDLANEIIAAQKRGVNVEVAIDSNSSKGTSIKVVQLLQKAKVPIFINRGNSLLHHKFLYIDGETLVNGSANWTKAAFTENDDCFMILLNLTKEQKESMEDLWKIIKAEAA